MNKRVAVGLAIVIGFIAVSAPIALSIYWAWKQSLNDLLRLSGSIADDVLRRTEASVDQTIQVLNSLKKASASDPCSDENIRLMAKYDLGSEQIQAAGYVAKERLLCSSFGRHDTVIGPPAFKTPYGTEIRILEFPVLPKTRFILNTDIETGYSVAIHPKLAIDVFAESPDVSVGVYAYARKGVVINRGQFKQLWIDRLAEARATEFLGPENVVASRRSEKYGLAAFAAIPTKHIDEGLRRTALLLVPFGVLAGVVLALAVLYVARQQLALPSVLKTALKRNEFFLVYQPIIELQGGRCVGAEALIRWRRPNGEMVRPDVFIPVAEDSGLIHAITKRVTELLARDASVP